MKKLICTYNDSDKNLHVVVYKISTVSYYNPPKNSLILPFHIWWTPWNQPILAIFGTQLPEKVETRKL